MIKYEEEGRQPLPLVGENKPQPEGAEKGEAAPSKERQVRPSKPDEPLKIGFIPAEEQRREIPPEAKPKTEPAPDEAIQKAPGPVASASARDAEKRGQGIGALDVLGRDKILDSGQPIDITSDTVESYFKDNLIVFKGNVTARQKDMVIYADSIEAVIIQDGKGIEKVVADGNVKVQQGLRVANCKKAVFYNLDKKIVLTGDPKLWEGDNMVSGEMIVFDIEQNRVDVKGGPGGRGKARIQQ